MTLALHSPYAAAGLDSTRTGWTGRAEGGTGMRDVCMYEEGEMLQAGSFSYEAAATEYIRVD